MKILAVTHAIPSRRIDNQFWRDEVRRLNCHLGADALAILDARVARFLEESGTETRFALGDGETGLELVGTAAERALSNASLAARDIDLVIYAGVARGWIEPAMAAGVQRQLSLTNAVAFDVQEACASWLRALELARSLTRTKAYRRIMIVNCECGLMQYCDLRASSVDDVDHRLASVTIGEAVTVTIVDDENPDDDSYFVSRTYGEHVDLCMIPLPSVSSYVRELRRMPRGATAFYAHSASLVATTARRLVELFDGDQRLRQASYAMCFGHAASRKAEEMIRRHLTVPDDAYVSTHADFGNTVSASVPLGISLAIESGRLRRGDHALLVVGSAGISVGLCSFTL
jgi:3-oxoacyl-[acyl-carrier-protein] synthase III